MIFASVILEKFLSVTLRSPRSLQEKRCLSYALDHTRQAVGITQFIFLHLFTVFIYLLHLDFDFMPSKNKNKGLALFVEILPVFRLTF